MKRYIIVLTALFSINAHAEKTGLDGLHGIVVSNLTFQKANNDMLRGLKAPTYENGNVNINPVIADSS